MRRCTPVGYFLRMTPRNMAAVGLTIVSLGLLWPGLTLPVLTISATMDLFGQTREIFHQSQSIAQTVKNLYNSGNLFVAGLVLLFSITVPLIKAALMAVILTAKQHRTRQRVFLFVRSMSKWAMADVFVVGVFIAFLAAKATDNLDAIAERGFYFFVSYCLLSNLAFQLLEVPAPVAATTPRES